MPVNAEVLSALERLEGGQQDVAVDFSAVRRVQPEALKALEKLADVADTKGVRVTLTGMNVDLYKVFKLVKLASRFAFRS